MDEGTSRGIPGLKTQTWTAIWVDDMPPTLDPGTIYISIKYRLTQHLCACGCGTEINLPLSWNQWCIEYNGETITIRP